MFTKENQVTKIGLPILSIEVLTIILGESFEECFSNRLTAKVDDVNINSISLEDLKKNKSASKHYKDLNDLGKLI